MDDKRLQEIVKEVVNSLTPASINLKQARYLIQRVEEEAEKIGVNAVVAVADSGGNTIAVECMDNSYIASYDIAVNKAFTCVSLKMTTKKLSTLAQPGQSLYGIQFTNNGRIVIFGGGVPLLSGDRVIGAVGVSGGTEEQDTYLGDFAEKVFKEEIL